MLLNIGQFLSDWLETKSLIRSSMECRAQISWTTKWVERPCHHGRTPVVTGHAVFPHPAAPVIPS